MPVALVTGDRKLAEEAKAFLGKTKTVTVKEAIGRTVACCLSQIKARQLIKQSAIKAPRKVDRLKSFKIETPINLKVAFTNPGMAEMAELVPSSKRVNGRTVSFSSKDIIKIYKAFLAMIALAGTAV